MKTLNRDELVTLIVEKDKASTMIGLVYVAPQKKLGKGRGKNSMINTLGIDSEKIMKHSKASFQGGSDYKNRDMKWREKNGLPAENYDGGEEWDIHYKKHTEYLIEHRSTGQLYIRLFDYTNTNLPTIDSVSPKFHKPTYSYEGKRVDIKDPKFGPFVSTAKPKPSIIRSYRFDRIKLITVDGVRYRVSAV